MYTTIYNLVIFFLLSGSIACSSPEKKGVVIEHKIDIDNYLSTEELNKLTSSIDKHMDGDFYDVTYKFSCPNWRSGNVVFTFDKKNDQLKLIKESYSAEEGSSRRSIYIDENNEVFAFKSAGSSFGCISPEGDDYEVVEQSVFLYKDAPAVGILKNAKNYDAIDAAKAKIVGENLDDQIHYMKELAAKLMTLKGKKNVQNFYCS